MISTSTLTVARVLLAVLFVVAGFGKLPNAQGFIGALDGMGVPFPVLAGWGTIVLELLAPVWLLAGWGARWAALALAAFTVAASFVGHAFWAVDAAQMATERTQFLKNLAIAGGLLAIALHADRGTFRDWRGGRVG